MGKSGEYIDYKAYVRYLSMMTGEPADPDSLRKSIMSDAEGRTEMQTVYVLLKALCIAAAMVFLASLLGAVLVVIRHVF